MKYNKITTIFLILLSAVLLSSCTGRLSGSSWPGISTTEDTIYVAYNNRIYAIRTQDGSTIWQYPEKAGRETYFAAPVLADGHLIAGDYQNNLFSLDPGSGGLKWTFTAAKGKWIASPLVVDGKIIAPNGDSTLYALDLNGNLLWKFPTKQALWSRPASDGERVYQASMDHFIYAIDLNSGEEIWSVDLGGAVLYSPTLTDEGVLYISSLGRHLVALNTKDGSILWQRKFDNELWTQPALADGKLFFGDISGKIYAIDSVSGADIWSLSVNEPVIGRPTEIENGIVFPTENGSLYAVSFSGERLWSRTFTGTIYTGPVVLGDNLAVGIAQGDDFLKFISSSTGQDVWTYVPPK